MVEEGQYIMFQHHTMMSYILQINKWTLIKNIKDLDEGHTSQYVLLEGGPKSALS